MREQLMRALAPPLPHDLVARLVEHFVEIRRNAMQQNLGSVAPGRFVEAFVQTLQFLSSGTFETSPRVHAELLRLESDPSLQEGLRLCATRAAQTMYTFRNKRGIAHQNAVGPTSYDQHFLCSSAQWIMTELIRSTSGCDADEAETLVRHVTAPPAGVVEDFGDRKLVLPELSVRDEILVLLHSVYPDRASQRDILGSLDRVSLRAVLTSMRSLWKRKLIDGSPEVGFRLTQTGLRETTALLLAIAV